MRHCVIQLVDANTGELIFETKKVTCGSMPYLRTKIHKNMDSLVNYIMLHPERDVACQVVVRDEHSPMVIPDFCF